jgi:putative transposase
MSNACWQSSKKASGRGTWPVFGGDTIASPGAISRRIKCLTVTDDFNHECMSITADFGIGGADVTRLLDRAATLRSYPKEVRKHNGPEFTHRGFMTWAQKHGIKHILIEPGSSTQNAYIENFNGTFCAECLDENWFELLEITIRANLHRETHYGFVSTRRV